MLTRSPQGDGRAPRSLGVRFVGRCASCGRETHNDFNASPSRRLCPASECVQKDWQPRDYEMLVSIFPDWRRPLDVAVLPSVRSRKNFDFFARWVGGSDDFPSEVRPSAADRESLRKVNTLMPFSTNHLTRSCGWQRCGSPLCFREKHLQAWITHPNVFVLDLANYHWSNTLKDPKSWAVVNVAVENNIRHLAVWTAGNAGLSLAKIVRAHNQHRRMAHHIRVYVLYDDFDESVDASVQQTLKNWECELIPVPEIRKKILPPRTIEDKVRDLATGLGREWSPDEYWDVTDGWDSVGIVMYRLLAAQVIRDLQPTHVVAPLGTGNLILGVLLGIADCERAQVVESGSVMTIGAMPAGDNIVKKIAEMRLTPPRYASALLASTAAPAALMPKIAGTYTPLLPCVDSKLAEEKLYFAESTQEQQQNAARALTRVREDRRILSEPSSISAFAVLPQVSNKWLRGDDQERVLVINTGFGLLSDAEMEFVSNSRA